MYSRKRLYDEEIVENYKRPRLCSESIIENLTEENNHLKKNIDELRGNYKALYGEYGNLANDCDRLNRQVSYLSDRFFFNPASIPTNEIFLGTTHTELKFIEEIKEITLNRIPLNHPDRKHFDKDQIFKCAKFLWENPEFYRIFLNNDKGWVIRCGVRTDKYSNSKIVDYDIDGSETYRDTRISLPENFTAILKEISMNDAFSEMVLCDPFQPDFETQFSFSEIYKFPTAIEAAKDILIGDRVKGSSKLTIMTSGPDFYTCPKIHNFSNFYKNKHLVIITNPPFSHLYPIPYYDMLSSGYRNKYKRFRSINNPKFSILLNVKDDFIKSIHLKLLIREYDPEKYMIATAQCKKELKFHDFENNKKVSFPMGWIWIVRKKNVHLTNILLKLLQKDHEEFTFKLIK